MILTCPDCATSYFVDDERVPAAGRTVKCSTCGNRWHAMPQAAEAEPEIEFVAPPPPAAAEAAEAPEPVAAEVDAPDDDLQFIAPAEVAPGKPRREKKAKAPKVPGRSRRGLILAGVGIAAVVALMAGAVVFRNEIVRRVPATGAVYAALGLHADELGLVIEDQKSLATFMGGRPVLSITGAIRNTRDETVEAPAFRISLLDAEGKPLAAKLVKPLNAAIPPGGKRWFAIAFADPPAGSKDLEMVFEGTGHAPDGHAPKAGDHAPAGQTPQAQAPEGDHAAAAHTSEAPHAVEAVLEPAPIEAKPLPPGSPDALPEHHG